MEHWREGLSALQNRLGCRGCKWGDETALALIEPCCTKLAHIDNDQCLAREPKDDRPEPGDDRHAPHPL